MSKHQLLSTSEAESYRPHPEILRYIARGDDVDRNALQGLRVLDWGCGRGRLVAFLLQRGMEAYGVDVDPETVSNGKAYFATIDKDADQHLGLIDSSGRTSFPDGFFDVIVSDNVLEHVPDLNGVMQEIARITKPGGYRFHLFPARFTLFEGHLLMPVIHWLPKNFMRKAAIRIFTQLGIEPRWPELGNKTRSEKAAAYFDYSCAKTFYRAPGKILNCCFQKGFAAQLVAIDHPRMTKFAKLLGRGRNPVRRFANRSVSELKTMELFIEKSMNKLDA